MSIKGLSLPPSYLVCLELNIHLIIRARVRVHERLLHALFWHCTFTDACLSCASSCNAVVQQSLHVKHQGITQ